jgi:Reverse transcriptase (RNA-dependent DNA polymerase)
VVLTIALSRGWQLYQLDMDNVFLHGELTEIVLIQQLPGFVDPLKSHHVYLLKKALYGLKHAPRALFQRLKIFLLSNKFVSSQADHSLYIYKSGFTIIYLLVYVDALLSLETILMQ